MSANNRVFIGLDRVTELARMSDIANISTVVPNKTKIWEGSASSTPSANISLPISQTDVHDYAAVEVMWRFTAINFKTMEQVDFKCGHGGVILLVTKPSVAIVLNKTFRIFAQLCVVGNGALLYHDRYAYNNGGISLHFDSSPLVFLYHSSYSTATIYAKVYGISYG